MKLQVPFIQLPLLFDAPVLAQEIAALGEAAWKPHPQGFLGNSMLPLVAVDGDPDNEAFAGVMQPTPHLLRCPYLMQVFASFGATVGRSRLMRLAGQAEVTRHADQGYYWTERVRVHVPVVTQPTVRFECGDAAINMQAGECWIFDTWRQHRVLNDASESRIHLVCDTVGGAKFWDMAARGRAVAGGQASAPVALAQVPVRPGATPELACESSNVPVVMSPWEMNTHLGFLLAEALPHPQLAMLQQIIGRFSRHWRELWARFGDRETGHPHFRELLARFVNEVRAPSQGVTLRNELLWYAVMMSMIASVAVKATVAPDATAAQQKAMGDNA